MSVADISAIPALVGAASGLVVPFFGLLWRLYRSQRDDRLGVLKVQIEGRRVEKEERDSASQSLLNLVRNLHEDIARLRGELDGERRLRVAAEAEVHALRIEIEALRQELRAVGVVVLPPRSAEPPVAGAA